MTAAAPWLRNEPAPDWRAATVAELVEAWKNGRNSHGKDAAQRLAVHSDARTTAGYYAGRKVVEV